MKNRVTVTVSRQALSSNFKIIRDQTQACAKNAKLIPMIKANAYGNGAVFAAQVLQKEKGVAGFGVATFSEAMVIRNLSSLPILVFSDCAPWTDERLALCKKFDLEPVFSEIVSLLEFQRQPGSHSVAAHVEVNTGMNRMGIPVESLSLLRFPPKSVFTHLADADAPRSSLTLLQMKRFQDVVSLVRAKYPRTLLHFANSSAIWNAKDFPLFREMDLVRPGLSLYGVRPNRTAKDLGLKRVMTLKASVLNKIFIERGERVGYGGVYTSKKTNGEWIATLGAGYGDGIFRSLGQAQSGAGASGIGVYERSGSKVRLLGRVSMDLCAVEIPSRIAPTVRMGDQVILWGDEIDPYEQADAADTIPYEIMTRIGQIAR